MIYLLDTDTIIYWMKGNRNISDKVLSNGYHNITASDITKAELYFGAYKSERKEKNLASIKILTEKINFLPFNDPAQAIYGEQRAKLEKAGNRLDDLFDNSSLYIGIQSYSCNQ